MSALCEEAVVCNYRCFSSLVAKTMNKCSCVTWQCVTEEPLLVSLFVCVLEITWLTLFCFSPSFFFTRASSAFEVAMWKSLATNPNKYNNRAISSLSERCCAFFLFSFFLSCQGGAGFCEHRAWSRASLPFPFPGLFLFVELRVFYRRLFPLFSIFHAVVVLFPITAYDETTRKPRPMWQEHTSCLVTGVWWGGGRGGWACSEGSELNVMSSPFSKQALFSSRIRMWCLYSHHSNIKLAFSLQLDRCVAIRKALKWPIHLYDGLTYLGVLADLRLPILTTSKWCLETTWNIPPTPPPKKSLSLWQRAAIPTIWSWKANLAAAGRNDCQQRLVPSGPCADKLSFILKLRSKVSWRRRGGIHKVI